MRPTLALCIPAYNAALFLPRLLVSARNQCIPFDEIWVYNDCSTDETEKVAKEYGAIVVNGEINKGCSYGKNALAAATSCDWIHFHDADDLLLPDFTRLAHFHIEFNDCPDIILFDYEYRDNNSDELLSIRHFDKVALEKDAISYSIEEQINPFCGLYRKSTFLKAGGYDVDPKILYNEDCAMHIKMAIAGLRYTAEETITIINYRVHNSMSDSNTLKCLVAQKEVIKQTVSRLEAKGCLSKYQTVLATKIFKIAGSLGAHSSWRDVRECLVILKRLDPNLNSIKKVPLKLLLTCNLFLGFKVKEYLIRILKPAMRRAMYK